MRKTPMQLKAIEKENILCILQGNVIVTNLQKLAIDFQNELLSCLSALWNLV